MERMIWVALMTFTPSFAPQDFINEGNGKDLGHVIRV